MISSCKNEFCSEGYQLSYVEDEKVLVLYDAEDEIIKEVQLEDESVNPKFVLKWLLDVAVFHQEKEYNTTLNHKVMII